MNDDMFNDFLRKNPWLGEPEDSTNYDLLMEWEEKFREAKPKSPAEFRESVKLVFPREVFVVWNMYCQGKLKRSWKGIETAARQMHLSDEDDTCKHKLADVSIIHTAANAILSILPEIRKAQKHDKIWSEVNFCRLCWRLGPAGDVLQNRPPLCEKHQVMEILDDSHGGGIKERKNPEYRKHKRLEQYFKDHYLKTKDRVGFLCEWNQKVTESKFPFLCKYLEGYSVDEGDLESILNILLLDVSDPQKTIAGNIKEWLVSKDGYIFGTFTYAEAWLSLLAEKSVGGDRRSKNSNSNYTDDFKEKAVAQALTSDEPIVKTATKIGIPETTLRTWIGKKLGR